MSNANNTVPAAPFIALNEFGVPINERERARYIQEWLAATQIRAYLLLSFSFSAAYILFKNVFARRRILGPVVWSLAFLEFNAVTRFSQTHTRCAKTASFDVLAEPFLRLLLPLKKWDLVSYSFSSFYFFIDSFSSCSRIGFTPTSDARVLNSRLSRNNVGYGSTRFASESPSPPRFQRGSLLRYQSHWRRHCRSANTSRASPLPQVLQRPRPSQSLVAIRYIYLSSNIFCILIFSYTRVIWVSPAKSDHWSLLDSFWSLIY